MYTHNIYIYIHIEREREKERERERERDTLTRAGNFPRSSESANLGRDKP